MKLIKRLLLMFVLGVVLIPNIVFAATGKITVSSASTGVVGNNLNVTVTLSSSTGIGSWEFDVSYDRSMLQLTSSTAESGGTHAANSATTAAGIKSKQYNYTFKVLKTGSTTIRVTSSDAYAMADDSRIQLTNGSKTVSLKTQAEIEASYSNDAYLKSITVGDYELTPSFDKEKYEYEVEVPNDVEKVTINATKNEANASVSGTGEKDLAEGANKFEIVCTAQKGNHLTYTVTVTRKELNPIKITIDGKDYTIVRKKDLLPELYGFVEDTTTYEDTEIPALFNEALNYKLIGVKDENNNVYTYQFDEGSKSVRSQYLQLVAGELIIFPINNNLKLKGFEQKEINIDGYKLFGLALSDKQVIIKGINPLNKDEKDYLYDIDSKTFIPIDITNLNKLNKNMELYKLIIIIIGIIVLLLLLLNIFKKSDKKKKKEEVKEEIEVEEITIEEKADEKEEIKEEVPEEVVEEKKLSKRAKKKIAQEEKKRLEELSDEEIEKKKEEIKKEEEALKERKKAYNKKKKEEPKTVEEVVDNEIEDEVDDPLNDEDDFMEFWETMEIKTQKKKD